MWNSCHVECVNALWGIYYLDSTLAWDQKFKTKAWATRTLNWLQVKNDFYQET